MKIYFSQAKEHEVLEYNSLLEDYVDGTDTTLKGVNSSNGEIEVNKFDHSLIVKVNVLFRTKIVAAYHS